MSIVVCIWCSGVIRRTAGPGAQFRALYRVKCGLNLGTHQLAVAWRLSRTMCVFLPLHLRSALKLSNPFLAIVVVPRTTQVEAWNACIVWQSRLTLRNPFAARWRDKAAWSGSEAALAVADAARGAVLAAAAQHDRLLTSRDPLQTVWVAAALWAASVLGSVFRRARAFLHCLGSRSDGIHHFCLLSAQGIPSRFWNITCYRWKPESFMNPAGQPGCYSLTSTGAYLTVCGAWWWSPSMVPLRCASAASTSQMQPRS